jgi:hypothetical protein
LPNISWILRLRAEQRTGRKPPAAGNDGERLDERLAAGARIGGVEFLFMAA